MKVQAFLFYGVAVFFVITDIVYWFMSGDWTGTTALGITVGMAGLVGFYTHFTVRRLESAQGGPLPEDNKEGEIADSAGDLGFFSPHSWWPLFVALAASVVVLGLVFGWWLFLVGVALIMLTVIGFVFEYYKGEFAR